MPQQNLYEKNDFFKLIIETQEYFVDEPIGWDKVKVILDRDPERYGFNYEFVDDKTTLEFVEYEGFELIRDIYETKDADYKIGFQYGYMNDNGTQQVEFDSTLNLNYYKLTVRGCLTTVEKENFESLFRTRSETKVSLSAKFTLDDGNIVPVPFIYTKLHSKVIKKQSSFLSPTEFIAPAEPIAANYDFIGIIQDAPVQLWLLPDTINSVFTEINEVPENIPEWIDELPANLSLYQLKAEEAGETTITITTKFNIQIQAQSIDGGFAQPQKLYFLSRLLLKRNGIMLELGASIKEANFTTNSFIVNAVLDTGTLAYQFNAEKDDEYYVNTSIYGYSKQQDPLHFRYAHVTNYYNDFNIIQNSVAPPTISKTYRAFDALNYILYAVTGRENALRSQFLETGCGKDWAISNGFQLRNFGTNSKPVRASITDVFEGFADIFNLGFGFFTDPVTGLDMLHVEPMDTFFGGQDIIAEIGDVYEYSEEHATEMVFNQVTVGFETFSDDQINALDDFSTYHEYLTPIKSFKASKVIKTNLIASGYAIETQRREQFKKAPSSSLPNDDNLFVLNIIQGERKYNKVSFNAITEGGHMVFGRAMGFVFGDKFTLTGGNNQNNNGIEYTVQEKVAGSFEDYLILPEPFADSGIATLVMPIETPDWVVAQAAEYSECAKDESFDKIEGLLSPESAYNLRISPKRILYNWATFFNIGFTNKGTGAPIKNTLVKNNGDLYTQLSPSDGCGITGGIKEGADMILAEFKYLQRPFRATRATFKTSMPYYQVRYIRDCLRGQDGPELTQKSFGQITYHDDKNRPWRAHVKSIEYIPSTETAQFIVYKIKLL